MISKEEVRKIAEEYLSERKRDYIELSKSEDVQFWAEKEALYGSKEGQILDMYTIFYIVAWGMEEKRIFIEIDAKTGEVLYSIGPTSWIEEIEDSED